MFEEPRFSSLALPLLRIVLLYALRGGNRATNSDWLDAQISTAQSVAERTTDTTTRDARNAADYFSGVMSFPIIRGSVYGIAKSMDHAAAFSAILRDSAHNSNQVYSVRVWHDIKDTGNFESNHKLFLQRLETNRSTWGFWHDWYLSMWEGRWTDWDLAHEIAKIDNDVWEAGAEAVAVAVAVAVEIKRIQARFRTSVATPIVRGSDDRSFHLDSETDLSRETLDFIKERVGGALASALEAGGNNGFDDTCYEAIAIQKALESKNPSAVAGLLADASFSFQTSIGKQYPEDGGLIALRAAAFAGSEEICEDDEAARKRCYRLAKLYVDQNATPINQTELLEFTDVISEEADDEVEAILRNDAKVISAGSKAGRFSRARFTNYATTIVQWIDKSRKGHGRAEWLWKTIGKLLDALKDAPPD